MHLMMKAPMKAARKLAVVIALSAAYVMPLPAAYAQDDEKGPTEARLENYPSKVTLEESGTATSWVVFLILSGLTILVMFKNANRTHLD
jgi:hypothetical protein